jgi:cytochrome c biogenesis protein CcdA
MGGAVAPVMAALVAAVVAAPVALAFSAGMLAAVNPCGFAMLPAYLGYFLGLEGERPPSPERAVARALGVGLIMTAGFVAVFGVVGLVVTQVSASVLDHAKWATIVIGVALVVLGVALLSGRELTVRLPHLDRGGSRRELGSMLLFGISYAVASLGCTLPTFLSATSSAFRRSGLASGVIAFVSYGLGMGLIVTALTLAVALARGSVVRAFRRMVRYVNRISGALLVVAGLYVAYYGWYEVRLARGGSGRDVIVDHALEVQQAMSSWIDRTGTTRLGLLCGLVLAGAGLAAWLRLRSPRALGTASGPAPSEPVPGGAAAGSRSAATPSPPSAPVG